MGYIHVRSSCVLAVLIAGLSGPSQAQVVPVRTVPVAAGDQFTILPSDRVAMGGVTLAVDDTLGDAWVNPAQGSLVRESLLLAAPTFYSISSDGGTGRTFPVAALFRGARWFGGAAVALQEIENPTDRFWTWQPWWTGAGERLSERSARNVFAQGFLGTRLDGSAWSLGLGFSVAALDAVDGVDLLYANAESIDQDGTVGDVRVGLYRDGERDRVGLVLVHDRVSMTHDVTYVDVAWSEDLQSPVVTRRVEENLDHTRTWGVQAAYDRALEAPGWRVGTSVTVNRKSHPKIPNYEIQNIPRDPGTTWAYELGVGIGRARGPTWFGLDLIFQPIWSDTWQEADEDVETPDGVIRKGGRTIENDFFFTNVLLRTGLSHQAGRATLRAGLEIRSYDVELEQRNHVEVEFREQDEAWMEWTPALGATFRFADMELRYTGRLTTGTGRPGVALTPAAGALMDSRSDFIIAAEGPLTLLDARVTTHQLAVSVPIR